ncbi:MAG: magnesium/cobalt transporter CorA [Flavobacteriaceae bacterium]
MKKLLAHQPIKPKFSRARRKIGKAPGTVTYLGRREKAESIVHVFDYNPTSLTEYFPKNIDEILAFKTNRSNSWINVIGITDEDFIEKLGEAFGLNPLLLEDAINTQQRPKIDEYESYIFGVFKMLYLDDKDELVSEHVAMVLFESCVLVFQEEKEDVFRGIRDRLTATTARIRSRGSDYLFFALLDAIIDNYFVVLENINHKMNLLEEEVYSNLNPEVAHSIQDLKKEVLKVRRYVYPVKELVARLIDTENALISKDTKLFLRDAHDHCLEINDSLQLYREMSMSLMEMYMSTMSNKMNEVMKVLTIMASIFIPLTFIVGVYGMNFKNMPELNSEYGYYVVWSVMVVLFFTMLLYFKKKQWL